MIDIFPACWICGKSIRLKEMPVHTKCENERRRQANEQGYYDGFQWEMIKE